MTYTIILALSTFLISLVGTRMVIATLRKQASPELRVIMGKAPPSPLSGGGFAMLFALVIGLLGSEIDYIFAFSMFLLGGLAMLNRFIRIPVSVEFIAQMIAVAGPVIVLKDPVFGGLIPLVSDHILAAGLWLLLLRLFVDSEQVGGVSAVQMITIGLGVCVIMVLTEQFPNNLSTDSIILATAGFGVLWWSWPPAKIWLGKIGLAPAGLVIGYLLLMAIQQGFGPSAFILGAYLLLEGIAPAKLRAGAAAIPHEPLARYIAGAHMFLVLLAALAALDPSMALFHLAAAYAMIAIFLWCFAYKSATQQP